MTHETPSFPRKAIIREVGLRDGLQAIQRILPTALKIEWIRDAYAAGQHEIEVGSFVSTPAPAAVGGHGELVAYAKTLPGLVRFGAGTQPEGRPRGPSSRVPT